MDSETNNVRKIARLPPPPGTFNDREEVIAYVRDFAVKHGFMVTIKKSKRESYFDLGCDRGGTTRRRTTGEPKRKRKVPSKLINCPFHVIGKKDDDVWVLQIKNVEHNHEPLEDMSEHPYNRRFSEDEVRQIKEMIDAGMKPREVLETLKRSNPELKSTPKQLYNLKNKITQGKFSETSFKTWKPTNKISLQKVSNFIGGKFVNSEGNVCADVVNPATQEVVSQVPSATYEEFRSAVFAARQAFPSWRKTTLSDRQRIMIKLLELIRRDIDKLASVISTEQGETIKRAHASIIRGLEVVEKACWNRTLQIGELVPNASTGVDMYSIREPLGVCAGICQCNYPAVAPLWMFPISIICGNTFVLNPSVKSPGASLKLVELAKEAGLPDGVLNVIHGGNDIVDHICGDDDIKAISFTGSYTTASHIYAQAAARGKLVEASIRCKNQAVVMPDACMDTTLDALIAAGFGAAGDPCTSVRSVIFVGSAAPWVEELVKRAKELRVYEGADESADIGPVISEEVKARICRSVQNAVERGASLILDGRNMVVPVYEMGSFVGPTILSGVTPSMEWFEEDVPGPLILCTRVNSLEAAITVVNQQKAKSGASIFTTSGFSAKKFQNEVEAKFVGINVPVSISLPFCSSGLTTYEDGRMVIGIVIECVMCIFVSDKIEFALNDQRFVKNPSESGNHAAREVFMNIFWGATSGKTGVDFYTQVKSVAQRWKGLTTNRISTTETVTSEENLTHQTDPMPMHLPSDFTSHDAPSSMSETPDIEMTNQERQVNRPPYDHPDIDINLSQTSKGAEDQPRQTTQGRERDGVPALDRYIPLLAEHNGMSTAISFRTDVSSPLDNRNLPSVPNHSSQTNDTFPPLTMQQVSMTSSSHRDEAVGSLHGSLGFDRFAHHVSSGSEFVPTVHQPHWNGNMVSSLTHNGSCEGNAPNGAYIQRPSGRVENMFETQGPDTFPRTFGETSRR